MSALSSAFYFLPDRSVVKDVPGQSATSALKIAVQLRVFKITLHDMTRNLARLSGTNDFAPKMTLLDSEMTTR